MNSNAIDNLAGSCRRRITWLLFLRYLVLFSTWWFFIWGATALVLRFALEITRIHLATGSFGIVITTLAAAIAAKRSQPQIRNIKAMLDHVNSSGGLVMTEMNNAAFADWQSKIPTLRAPEIQWSDRRMLSLFTAAAVFLLGSFALPNASIAITPGGRMEIGNLVEELKSKIELLDEQDALEEQASRELMEKLEQVWKESSADDPVKSWEAFDNIEKKLENAAAKSASEDITQTESLARIKALSEELSELMKNNITPENAENIMKDLADLIKAQGLDEDILKALNPELLKKNSNFSMSAEQLAARCNSASSNLCQNVNSLCDAKLVDPRMSEMAQKAAESDCDLAKFLSENCSSTNSMSACMSMFGKGGRDRGRGDAPMTWTNGTSEEGVKFQEKVLPSNPMMDINKTVVTGVTPTAPDEPEGKTANTSGALVGATEGGGSARRQAVFPRHQSAVERYFERKNHD